MESHHGSLYTCQACFKHYQTKRDLSNHLSNSTYCNEIIESIPNQKRDNSKTNDQTTSHIYLDNESITNNKSESSEDLQMIDNESNNASDKSNCLSSTEESNRDQPYHFSNNKFQEIKLLKLMNELGTPLYAYRLIMEWAKDAHLSNFNFDSQHTSHKQMIKYLQKKLQIKMCQPTITQVKLIQDSFIADVVTFDVKQMLMSLFDNQELSQRDNLVVNASDMFSKYEPEDDRYGEINSGTWYNKAYDTCINDPEKDFLCPIVLANDKTTLSDMGDLHVDAIFMTTSIFNIKASTTNSIQIQLNSLY